jgi:hypothetical protein
MTPLPRLTSGTAEAVPFPFVLASASGGAAREIPVRLPLALPVRSGQALAPRLRRPRLKPGVYRKARSFGMTHPNCVLPVRFCFFAVNSRLRGSVRSGSGFS